MIITFVRKYMSTVDTGKKYRNRHDTVLKNTSFTRKLSNENKEYLSVIHNKSRTLYIIEFSKINKLLYFYCLQNRNTKNKYNCKIFFEIVTKI